MTELKNLFSTTKKIFYCGNCDDIWTSDQVNHLEDDKREATCYCLNCQSSAYTTIFVNINEIVE